MKEFYMKACLGVALGFAALPVSVHAKVIATCGASSGQAHFGQHGQWFPDGIRNGLFQFSLTPTNEIQMSYRDVTGVLQRIEDKADLVTTVSFNSESNEFALVVIYGGPSVQVETYILFIEDDSSLSLQWTSNRSAGDISGAKVSAFFSRCI